MSSAPADNLAARIEAARHRAAQALLQRASPNGSWRGSLSASALSTAVAAQAWRICCGGCESADRALDWLCANANSDGGWGDTTESPSNLATTLLAWSALCARLQSFPECATGNPAETPAPPRYRETAEAARRWLHAAAGSTGPAALAQAVLSFYRADRTFSVPILTHCALAGTLGDTPWTLVPQLPFELAILPPAFFRLIRLPVVSYALPALIAIGMVRHVHTHRHGLRGCLRTRLIPPLLRKLQAMQPADGGFLEAAPLTGFVVMALAASGFAAHPVARAGLDFLARSQRADGSLPIDTDLCLWLSTHAIRALDDLRPPQQEKAFRKWLLAQQQARRHPFTQAEPGGWAWTDQPGGVPDADDTSGALLALAATTTGQPEELTAASHGVRWLLQLQNRDGGIPTFCRGWGALPFDRSCPDITAHALHAIGVWRKHLSHQTDALDRARRRGLQYLARAQYPDGSWLPLWFGNQHAPGQENPVLGTALVCLALQGCLLLSGHDKRKAAMLALLQGGCNYLSAAQNTDGGWGGVAGAPSSVEETALALAALAPAASPRAVRQGTEWLLRTTHDGTIFPASPIGLYFSALWYHEELYPLLFSLRALQAVRRRLAASGESA